MNTENLLVTGLFTSLLLTACAQNRPGSMGISKGQLSPCPRSPNCVSSQSTDEKHWIEPLSYHCSTADAMATLKEIVNSMKRSRIVTVDDRYLYAEFRSSLFRFIDDVEFYLDSENCMIHVRSASRVGYWDFGVNRRRVEAIRSKLSKQNSS